MGQGHPAPHRRERSSAPLPRPQPPWTRRARASRSALPGSITDHADLRLSGRCLRCCRRAAARASRMQMLEAVHRPSRACGPAPRGCCSRATCSRSTPSSAGTPRSASRALYGAARGGPLHAMTMVSGSPIPTATLRPDIATHRAAMSSPARACSTSAVATGR